MATAEVKISELPEEVTADGLKIYGPASYETQVAILSQYLHTLKGKHDIYIEVNYEVEEESNGVKKMLFIDDYDAMDSEL